MPAWAGSVYRGDMCVCVCVCVSLSTHYTCVGVLGKDVCGRSVRRRRLCDIQIETAVFPQCVYVCETLLQSVDCRNSYRGPAACKSASMEICCLHIACTSTLSQKLPA